MNEIKFSKDFKKLDGKSFSTVRRGHKWKLGHTYLVITPTKKFKAKLYHAMAYKFKDISEDFLIMDTETENIEEAVKLLNSFYDKKIGKDERVYVLVFTRVDD